jgi:hypothetical protein
MGFFGPLMQLVSRSGVFILEDGRIGGASYEAVYDLAATVPALG